MNILFQKYERENIADALVSQAYGSGDKVVAQVSCGGRGAMAGGCRSGIGWSHGGDIAILQGDRANGMYFVESGTLVVLKGIDGDEKEVIWRLEIDQHLHSGFLFQVNELHQGEYFGELGLVNHMPRAATVAARDDVRVACELFGEFLNVHHFLSQNYGKLKMRCIMFIMCIIHIKFALYIDVGQI